MSAGATIFLVDDDSAVRDALTRLLEAAGYAVEAYPDAEAFLAAYEPRRAGCPVLDMQMPGMGGLGLQAVLAERQDSRPIIFLTAHGTVPTTVRALKNGAFEFLEKPAEGGALLAQVRNALQRDAERRREAADRDQARLRCATLTRRERDILPLVATGTSNKDIARQLGISHRTGELHRMRILRKTGAHTVVELAAIAQRAGFSLTLFLGDDVPPPETR
jgi:two-component system, LuxR family, response regulator FixJ